MANAGTLCTVTGDIETPGTLSAVGGKVRFRLNKFDAEADQIIVPVEQVAIVGADGTVSIDLWRNVTGAGDTWYQITYESPDGNHRVSLGQITVPDASTADLDGLKAVLNAYIENV